jgi:polyribonucleotide nucleotidyltransferase
VLKEGQDLMVKVISIDHQGRIKLSRKALIEPEPGQVVESSGGHDRPHDRGGHDRDRGGGGGGYRGPGGSGGGRPQE